MKPRPRPIEANPSMYSMLKIRGTVIMLPDGSTITRKDDGIGPYLRVVPADSDTLPITCNVGRYGVLGAIIHLGMEPVFNVNPNLFKLIYFGCRVALFGSLIFKDDESIIVEGANRTEYHLDKAGLSKAIKEIQRCKKKIV